MNSRVKELRNTLHRTLDDFAAPLGVQKSAISKIERGENALSDQMVKAICREYGVSETWLRTGEGEMFINRSSSDNLKKKIDAILADEDEEFRLRLVRMLLAMDKEDIQKLEAYARKYLIDAPAADQAEEDTPAAFPEIDEPIIADTPEEREMLLEFRRQKEEIASAG